MKRTQTWVATKIPNLFMLKESGVYYLRVKPKGGSQIRESLQTANFKIARVRMRERLLELGVEAQKGKAGTWGSLVEPWRIWLSGQKVKSEVTDSTIEYKLELLDQIRTTWPKWDTYELSELSEARLAGWLVHHRAKYSATRTNGAITALREMLAIAVRDKVLQRAEVDEALHGLKFTKVIYDYKRMTLELPEPHQVTALHNEIYRRCKIKGTLGGYLFDGILFSGMRIDSAGAVRREDVHRNKGVLYVRQAKYGPYTVPLFPELLRLIDRIEKNVPGGPKDRLFPTKTLQTVLSAACKHLGLAHISHQDIRHIFATRCIEQGVDIPTVASWLGHKDGGRTAMAIYGHLRQTHSQAQAKAVRFLDGPAEPGAQGQQKEAVEQIKFLQESIAK